MRHTIGGMWLLQLMVLFIFLFAAFIILTLNYSKTIKIKNEMISMIEKYEGLNDASIELVNNYLLSAGYNTTGVCTNNINKSGIYGATDLFETTLEEAQPGEKYYYCVKKYRGTNLTNYYQVAIFYKFNLPVIGETSHFNVKGTTSNFHASDDIAYSCTIDGTCVSNQGANNGNRPIQPVTYYTVTFNSDGGSNVESKKVLSGSQVSQPVNPTKEGYTFEGWLLKGNSYNFYTPITSDITLVAKWTSISQSTGSDTLIETIDDSAVITNWNNVIKPCGNSLLLNKNIIIDFNGGTSSTVSGSYTSACIGTDDGYGNSTPTMDISFSINNLNDINGMVNLVRPGYTFKCWADENNQCISNYMVQSRDIIIHAIWERN